MSPGHTHVIPVRHDGSFFELLEPEQMAMLALLNRARAQPDGEFAPDGYTIGINDGAAAGQTVPHVHMRASVTCRQGWKPMQLNFGSRR